MGDTTPGATAYSSYYYRSGTTPAWTSETDGGDAGEMLLFKPFRAVFTVTSDGAESWKIQP